jgi:hypothetical protein
MSKMSNYLESALLNRVLRGQAYTPPASVYLGLLTAFTTGADGDTLTEVTGGGYARQSITFGAPSAGATVNTNAISFPEATGNYGTVNYAAIFDASTAGNVLYWIDPTDISVNTGETFSVDAGNLSVSLSGNLTQAYAHTLLNASLRNTALSIPSIYIALLTAFTNDSTFTECGDATYARQQTTWTAPSGGNGLSDNAADVVWAAATTGFTATHAALFDASTAGNMLFRGPLSANKVVGASKVFKILTGALDVTLD